MPRCEKCDRDVEGTVVTAMERSWHPGCFTCFRCDADLSRQSFKVREAKPVCMKCDIQYYVPKCFKCQEPVTSVIVNAMDEKWHTSCFLCTHCQCELSKKSFLTRENHPICIDCEKSLYMPNCVVCLEKINPTERYTTFDEMAFHENCFICKQCGITLSGKQFISKGDAWLCVEHG